MKSICLTKEPLSYSQLKDYYYHYSDCQVQLDDSIWADVNASADCVT